MPGELVAGIDRIEGSRSRFITEAMRWEIQRRQRRELLHSPDDHHPDSDLPDPAAGVAVCWTHAHGWQEREP